MRKVADHRPLDKPRMPRALANASTFIVTSQKKAINMTYVLAQLSDHNRYELFVFFVIFFDV